MASALYQRYRPGCFSEVFGETHIIKALKSALNNDLLSHAYIFSGPRGIGKTTIAKIMAKAVNCLALKDGDACNRCENCQKINTNQTLDVLELDAASNNGVAEIRQIIDSINYLPADLKKKVYILDEAHMLTNGAWNALLKTLEECPEHAVFIFATTEYHKIPLTVVSRCQCYSFKRLAAEIISSLITNISKIEKIKITQDAINKIAVIADGSARDAISLLDQLSSYSSHHKIDIDDINTIFGLLDETKKIEFINLLASGDLAAVLKKIEEFEADGIHFGQLIENTFGMFVDIYLYEKTDHKSSPKYFQKKDWDKIKLSGEMALVYAGLWEDLTGKIRFNPQIRNNLELAIFKGINATKKIVKAEHQELKLIKNKPEPIIKPLEVAAKLPDREPQDRTSFILPMKTEKIDTAQSMINPTLNIDDVFTTVEIDIPNLTRDEGLAVEQATKSLPKIKQLSAKEIFIRIANFQSANFQKKYQSILEKVKLKKSQTLQQKISKIHQNDQWLENHPSTNLIVNASKVLIGADQGMVLLFNTEDECLLLNAKCQTTEFIYFVNELFGTPLYIIGVTKIMGREYRDAFIDEKKTKKIKKLSLTQLNKLLIKKPADQVNDLKAIALKYFGDALIIEDDFNE